VPPKEYADRVRPSVPAHYLNQPARQSARRVGGTELVVDGGCDAVLANEVEKRSASTKPSSRHPLSTFTTPTHPSYAPTSKTRAISAPSTVLLRGLKGKKKTTKNQAPRRMLIQTNLIVCGPVIFPQLFFAACRIRTRCLSS